MGMQAVDLAIQNGVDLDGTPIPQKMLDLYNRIMDEENKRQRSGVKKSMRNRCVKTVVKVIVPSALIILFNIKAGRLLFKSPVIGLLSALPTSIFIFRGSLPLVSYLNNWIEKKNK